MSKFEYEEANFLVDPSRVLAVIVTYNRLQKLRKCVEAIRSSDVRPDILIVDNHSSDGTADWLVQSADKLGFIYVSMSENVGGAGGFNRGVEESVKRRYERVWLMDDDCIVRKDTLSELLRADALLDGDYGWLSSVALWVDGSPCLMNKQKTPTDYYGFAHLLKDSLLIANQATFVSMFLKTETVTKVGLPIKEFFIWGDDVEFTRRIAVRYGLRSFVVGRSLVTHEMADNKGSNISTSPIDRISRYSFAYRNEAYLFRKEGLKGSLYFIAKCLYNTWRVLRYSSSHRLKRLSVLWMNAIKGLFFNPDISYPA